MRGDELIQVLASPDSITFFDIYFMLIINIVLVIAVKFIFDGIEYAIYKRKPELKLKSFINYSSIIGFVERCIYIVGIWTINYQLITIVIAVKTIMRFPTINATEKGASNKQASNSNKITAEKYILGTLLNLLFSFVIVWIFKG